MKAILLSIALCLAGSVAAYRLFPRADSMGPYPAMIGRQEAIDRARRLAARYGRDVADWPVWVRANRNLRMLEFLRTGPDHPLARTAQPLSFTVCFTRGPHLVRVELLGDGMPSEFYYRDGRRPDFIGAPLDAAQRRAILDDFAGRGQANFREVSSVDTATQGHATAWEWVDPAVRDAIVRVESRSAPDGVRSVALRHEMSAEFMQRMTLYYSRVSLRITVIPVLMVLGIAITNTLLFPGLARRRVRIGPALRLAGLILLANIVSFWLGPDADAERIEAHAKSVPMPEMLFGQLAGLVPFAAWFAAMWAVGRWLMVQAGSERWRTFDALLAGDWWRRQVGRSAACGLLLGAALTAIPLALCAARLFPLSQSVNPSWLASPVAAAIPLGFQLPSDLTPLFFLLVPLASSPLGRRWVPVWLRWMLFAVLAVVTVGFVRAMVSEDLAGNLTTGALLAAGFFAIYWQFGLLGVLASNLGFWAAQASIYFLHQSSDELRLGGAMTAAVYASLAAAGIAAFVWARDLEVAPEEVVIDAAAQREIYNAEFSLAQRAQQRLLPDVPARLDGFSLAASCHPARDVGGDLYDFFTYPDGTYGFCVADVSGKGVPAALYMTMTKGILAAASRDIADLRGLAIALNGYLHAAGRNKTFVTMALGRLDAQARTLEHVRAGHNSILWRRAARGESVYVKPRGVGLGLASNLLFERSLAVETLQLASGDLVVFYSDGITEAMNPRFELFGEERLQAVVESNAGLDAAELQREILREVRKFMDGEPPHDDMTLFILRA